MIYRIVDGFKVDKNEEMLDMTHFGSSRVNPNYLKYSIEMDLDKKNYFR